MNDIHNALLKNYMSKWRDKLKSLTRDFGGLIDKKELSILVSQVIERHTTVPNNIDDILESLTRGLVRLIDKDRFFYRVFQIIEEFLAIPKVTNLLEFSFLVNNAIAIKPSGWFSLHYRGENRAYQHPCRSSYFRLNETKDSEREIKEINAFKGTSVGKDIIETLSRLKLDPDHYYWWFLTQHHSEEGKKSRGCYFQTRLLDVSKNPYVALFFSCLDDNESDGKDGYVYLFYDLELTKITRRPQGYGPHDQLKQFKENPYKTFIDYIQDAQDQFEIDRLVPIEWNNLSQAYDLVKRVVAQSGDFYAQKRLQRSYSTWQFLIDGKCKQKIRDDLSKYLNINNQTLLLD